MLQKEVNSSVRPKEVEIFPGGKIYLRKNIREINDEEKGKYFEYDEVFFVSDASEEEILADFDSYWYDAIGYGIKVSLEDRLDAIEELMEEMIDG